MNMSSFNVTDKCSGRTFIVEPEAHSYRIRFWLIETNVPISEDEVNQDKPLTKWVRLGYLGSYMSGSHTAGYMITGSGDVDSPEFKFNTKVRGMRTGAKACIATSIIQGRF